MKNRVFTLSDLPPGFRFLPEDEELINDYLTPKINGHDYPNDVIPEVDLCKVEPRHVPGLSIIKSKYPEWFFFSPVDYKYLNSKRVNRTTVCGFWKNTGNDRNIKAKGTNDVIGTKKTLVYYEGRVPNDVKSNWVIHEYHAVTDFHQTQRGFVLCLLKSKAAEGGTDILMCDEGEPNSSGHMASSDHENIASEEENPAVGALPEMHQEEIDISAGHLSPIGIELEACSSAHDAYFKNEANIMQTPFETIEEGNEFPASISTPIQELGVEHESSLIRSLAHNTCFKNYDETIEEDNDFITQLPQLGVGHETFLKMSPVHNAYLENYDEIIEENNDFITSFLFPIQQSPIDKIVNKHESSFTSFPVHNASFENEKCWMQTPFETIEGRNEFSTSTQESLFQTTEGRNEFSTSILNSKTIEDGKEFSISILTSLQESQINIESEVSFKSFPAQNTCFRKEDCHMQTPETIEEANESLTSYSAPGEAQEETEFFNSILANENFVPNKESGQLLVNNSTQIKTLKRVYYESYDTDAEVASAQNGNVVDTSAMSNDHSSSGEYQASKMLKSTHVTIGGGIHLFSSYQEANKEENIFQNDFCEVETSSCDSTIDKPIEVNCVEISSSPPL